MTTGHLHPQRVRGHVLSVAIVALLCSGGAAQAAAWFDARSLVLFELAGAQAPRDTEPLVRSLNQGLLRGLSFAPDRRLIQAVGSGSRLDTLRIDLSAASSKPDYRAPHLSKRLPARPHVHVKHFELIARPIVIYGAQVEYVLRARDVRLDEYRNRLGQPVLVLAAASEAKLQCRISEVDLQWLVLIRAREAVRKAGVEIESAHLDLKTVDERSLQAKLSLKVRKGVLAGALCLAGGIRFNDQFVGQTDNIRISGLDPVGAIFASVIDQGAREYNGRTRDAVSFPSPDLELRDLRFARDRDLTITMVFGNRLPSASATATNPRH